MSVSGDAWDPVIVGAYELVDIEALSRDPLPSKPEASEHACAQALVVEAVLEQYPNEDPPGEPDDETITMSIWQPDYATGVLMGVWIGYDQEQNPEPRARDREERDKHRQGRLMVFFDRSLADRDAREKDLRAQSHGLTFEKPDRRPGEGGKRRTHRFRIAPGKEQPNDSPIGVPPGRGRGDG